MSWRRSRTGRASALTLITDPRARRRLFRAIGTAAATAGRRPRLRRRARRVERPPGRCAGRRARPTGHRPPARAGPDADACRSPAAGTGPAVDGEPESAALLLLFSSADTPLQWLRVGEVTSAILLTAARHGLAASALTQPLEVGETRGLVADRVLGARTAHPHMLFRIGWPQEGAPAPRPTPRRPVAEVVEVDR